MSPYYPVVEMVLVLKHAAGVTGLGAKSGVGNYGLRGELKHPSSWV